MQPADLASAAAEHGLGRAPAAAHIDPFGEHPALAAAAARSVPWLTAAREELGTTLLAAPTCRPFERGPFFRPPRHARAFYFAPGAADGGVLAIKGTEPLAPDFDLLLFALRHLPTPPALGSRQRRVAEHFALVEHKVPGAVTLSEATAEARIAAAVHERHLAAYGTLAHVPLPVGVFRLPAEVERGVFERLKLVLSPTALERVAHFAHDGLGAYAYYYPARAPRLAHAVAALPPATRYRARRAALEQPLGPDALIGRWTALFARLLHLGYLPGTLAAQGLGVCCDVGNAVMDGGFADLGSVTPLDDVDDAALREHVLYAVSVLVTTVRHLLVGPLARTEPSADPVVAWVRDHVLTRCREALAAEARPGLTLDPRVAACFDPAVSFAALSERLEAYFASPFDAEEASRSIT